MERGHGRGGERGGGAVFRLCGEGDRWVWLTTTVGFVFVAGVDMLVAMGDVAGNYRSIPDRSLFLVES